MSSLRTTVRKVFGVFTQSQTYLNLLYLGCNVVFGFGYYLVLHIGLSLSWGLVIPILSISSPSIDWLSQIKLAGVVVAGLLVIPILIFVLQLPVLPEIALARYLLKVNPSLDLRTNFSNFRKPLHILSAPSTWARLLFVVLKIPLGIISFFGFFNVLLPAAALMGMPLVYLAGFRDLIFGTWRFDTVEKALLAFLAGIFLLPISLHGMNLLAKFCAWLAKTLLLERKIYLPIDDKIAVQR